MALSADQKAEIYLLSHHELGERYFQAKRDRDELLSAAQRAGADYNASLISGGQSSEGMEALRKAVERVVEPILRTV